MLGPRRRPFHGPVAAPQLQLLTEGPRRRRAPAKRNEGRLWRQGPEGVKGRSPAPLACSTPIRVLKSLRPPLGPTGPALRAKTGPAV